MKDPRRVEDLFAATVQACRRWSLSLLIASLAPLAACAMLGAAKPVAVPSIVQSPGTKTINVTDSASGASIVLDPAQELIVSLPTNPGSGREWRLIDLKPGVLEVRSSRFERALRNANDEGSSGATVWRFAAQAPGSVALTFDLRRPRNVEPAAQTVTYSVTVK